jgi:hypothetical protein
MFPLSLDDELAPFALHNSRILAASVRIDSARRPPGLFPQVNEFAFQALGRAGFAAVNLRAHLTGRRLMHDPAFRAALEHRHLPSFGRVLAELSPWIEYANFVC